MLFLPYVFVSCFFGVVPAVVCVVEGESGAASLTAGGCDGLDVPVNDGNRESGLSLTPGAVDAHAGGSFVFVDVEGVDVDVCNPIPPWG